MERVELGLGYWIKIVVWEGYRQFLAGESDDRLEILEDA